MGWLKKVNGKLKTGVFSLLLTWNGWHVQK